MASEVKKANTFKMVTARTSVNIAVIKYWGKKDETFIIPINDSISGTLDSDDLCTTTTVAISPNFTHDRMWLNEKEVVIEDNKRLVQCLKTMREKVSKKSTGLSGGLRISSFNNFPTAAGLASSAAGYACLVYALGNLFGITDKEELSVMARMGSGSAIRSLEGGFVQWISGNDSNTSVARQIVDESHWPDMRVLILVVADHAKETGSTDGMKRSVETSSLIHHRANIVVPDRVQRIKKAIIEKDFPTFAEITMQDSNQFHAIAQDTYPPIRYMTDVSWSIVDFVHKFNALYGSTIAAYTFDAGPNACIYIRKDAVKYFVAAVCGALPAEDGCVDIDSDNLLSHVRHNMTSDYDIQEIKDMVIGDNQVYKSMRSLTKQRIAENLKYIIYTKIGRGAEVLSSGPDLLDSEGQPLPIPKSLRLKYQEE
jgi:diphosphomevalonate decarboxylase